MNLKSQGFDKKKGERCLGLPFLLLAVETGRYKWERITSGAKDEESNYSAFSRFMTSNEELFELVRLVNNSKGQIGKEKKPESG